MIFCRDRVFTEKIKLKPDAAVLMKRVKLVTERHTKGRQCEERHREKMAIYRPRRGAWNRPTSRP